MNAIIKNIRQLANFARTLGRDVRGDDASNASVHATGGIKLVAALAAGTGIALAAASAANSASMGSDNAMKNINAAQGAGAATTQQINAPYKAQ